MARSGAVKIRFLFAANARVAPLPPSVRARDGAEPRARQMESAPRASRREQARAAMARARLRKEGAFEIEKVRLDEQARFLLRANYVYKSDGKYRSDLVAKLPSGSAVPE